jgi:hypothetical protein
MADKRPTQKEAQAAAGKLIAKLEGTRQKMMQEMAATAKADADRAPAELEKLRKIGAPPELIAERQRQMAGLVHLANYTALGTSIKRDPGRAPSSVVLTGRVLDAKGKSPGEVTVRFTDASGTELATEKVAVDQSGDFVADVDAKKLGDAEVTATLVSPSGKPLHDEPLTFQPAAGSVATLNATVKKRK